MICFEKMLEIAKFLERDSIVKELQKIHDQETQENADLILALVGEFSAGKTSLINSLTDSKALETATLPTTATIYDVHFGANKNRAVVYEEDGSSREVDDISSLKNADLKDSKIVSIYDTSCKVPSTTVLVDTPGLSSPDPKHREVLCKFLPNADAVLMVVDINQQLTRSLSDFIKTAKMAKKKIFLVITKCDTKDASQKQEALSYIAQNCDLPLENCACVSSKQGDLAELYEVFDQISKNKKSIIAEISQKRYEQIAEKLKEELVAITKIPQDDESLRKEIAEQKSKLKEIERDIDNIISLSQNEIERCAQNTCSEFESKMFDQLDSLATSEGIDYDKEIPSKVQSVSSIFFNNLKDDVVDIVRKTVSEQRKNCQFSLLNAGNLNLDGFSMSQMTYNLKMNDMGHKYDKVISTGVMAAAAAATVYFAGPILLETAVPELATLGSEATAEVVAEAVADATLDTAIEAADVVTDIGSVVAMNKIVKDAKSENPVPVVKESAPEDSGMLEKVVGFIGDKAVGKPQRRKAIHAYLDGELLPQFKHQVKSLVNKVSSQIRDSLNLDAKGELEDLSSSLEKLRECLKNGQESYENHLKQVKSYINQIG